MYYHRALRGLREIYIAFHWNCDPAKNAQGMFRELYVKMPEEMEERVETCVREGKITEAQWKEIELLGDLWMSEVVDHDRGDMTTCSPILAPEAERHGDFTAAEVLRRGEAHFYRSVAIPYHEKAASACEKRGEKVAATLHQKAVREYGDLAAVADRIAQGHRMLMEIPELRGPGPVKFGFYPDRNLNPIPNEYIRRRWWGDDSENQRSNRDIYSNQWKGLSTREVSPVLKVHGLKHPQEDARFSTVMVLADLGERDAVLSALSDSASQVRLAAAKALAFMRWADGWAACYKHADEDVRSAVAPLFVKSRGDVRSRTFIITELMQGLNSTVPGVNSFCQSFLQRVTGKHPSEAKAWLAWWEEMGNAQPGLKRAGGGIPEGIDGTIDFGAWWRVAIQHAPNPMREAQTPSTFRWDGYIAVDQPGDYRFFARNRGEGRNAENATGRDSLGLFIPGQAVKLTLDGKDLIPDLSNEMLDPTAGVRLDFSDPIRLDAGLHKIRLEFEWRGGHTPGWWHGGQPVIRLYWSSEHFPRELVPADHLIHLEKGS